MDTSRQPVPRAPVSGTSLVRIDDFIRSHEDDVASVSRTVVAPRHATDFLRRASQYERQGMLAEAAFLYRQAASCESVAALAMHRCGQLERQVGHPRNAVETLKHALHHAVNDRLRTLQIYIELGDLYAQLSDRDEAAYYYRRALRMDPGREDVNLRLRAARRHADDTRLDRQLDRHAERQAG